MAKFKSIIEFNDKLSKDFKTTFGREFLSKVGYAAYQIIYRRTKSGKGVQNGKLIPLKKLSKSYVDYRKTQTLGRFASPSKSNLTFTGQMLDSFLVQVNKQVVSLTIADTQREDGEDTNLEVAEKVTKEGRPFLDLSDGERQIIVKIFEDELRRLALRYK